MNGEYLSLEDAKKIRRYDILLKKIRLLKKENQRLRSVIKQIYDIFQNGRFEDGCDCYEIETLITEEVEVKNSENRN